ncbi:hypothetical protein GA0070613_5069 [Micromonospora inositola]|uniref:PH domain-containing protein n=2 Tax=Micromonospora inositola TaxID=47865 RepID=A0A1C5JPH6_9ACTN|nr:hypothetical protein GA0070613_5069 [Micromonospora inositola]
MHLMLSKIIGHRWMFLVSVLCTAVALGSLLQAQIPIVSVVCAALLALLTMSLAVAGIVASSARRPATFLPHPGAFAAPPHGGTLLSTGMLTVITVQSWVWAAERAHRGLGPDRLQIAVAALLLLLLPLAWYGALGRFGMILRPDGILDRQPLGSIFVPWEAAPTARPARHGVKLGLAHPELLVRRGIRPGTMIATGADPAFTARAINMYTARPDYRPTIGTHDGLRHLPDH